MSTCEITVGQFRAFCEATGREMPDPPATNAYGQAGRIGWQNENPMLATWEEANAFAKWIKQLSLAHEECVDAQIWNSVIVLLYRIISNK